MSSINPLPFDALDSIVSFTPLSTLPNICLVSRELNTIGTSQLYREVTLMDNYRAVICLKALVSNDHAAKSVRALYISNQMDLSRSASLLSAFFRLLSKSIRRVIKVKDIQLYFKSSVEPPFSNIDSLFDGCTLPELHTIRVLNPPVTPGFAAFIGRHQEQLEYISYFPGYHDRNLETSWFPALNFQNISTITTSTVVAIRILEESQLPELTILEVMWLNDDSRIYDAFISAARKFYSDKRRRVIPSLEVSRNGWNIDLIRDVSEKIPNLTSFHVTCKLIGDETEITGAAFPDSRVFGNVVDYLSRLRDLEGFEWKLGSDDDDTHPWWYYPQREYEDILRLKAVCPKLFLCKLPYGVCWLHAINDLWQMIETTLTPESPRFQWIYSHIRKRSHPAQKTLMQYLRDEVVDIPGAIDTLDRYEQEEIPISVEQTLEMMELGMNGGLWDIEFV
ncbi:hypothetical protein VNI00_010250 [Paramarasmius palmivorus]|uniref:F-box domain-containing protein n=1 Tax=Paramarasmius palmivorus TaxID=297713 RepID=A0AAW0CKM2_9AGAR